MAQAGVARAERPPVGAAGSSASDRSLRWVLAVCSVAQLMVILDLSIVNVALPSIQSALSFSAPELQWVVDGYAITFAGFLLLGGRIADYYGQRRTFLFALAGFSLASLLGGLAPDRTVLIAARALQGLAAAFMASSSLAIVTSTFPAGPARNRAIAIWASMNGVGGAAGVLLSGVLTQEASWRWVLLINPPIGLVGIAVALKVIAERKSREQGASFDFAGALALTVGQLVLVFGVVEAGIVGWSATAALVPIAVGVLLLAAFVGIEEWFAQSPIVPLKRISSELKLANLIVLLFSAALFPMWFVSSLYLQQVLGLSPLQAGLTFLPMTLTIMVIAQRGGHLVNRFGVKPVLFAGLCFMAAGLALFTRVQPSGSAIPNVVAPGVLTTAGIALSIVSSTIAATRTAGAQQAGLASGLVNTSRQVGGGLGLAVLITLATQLTTHQIGTGKGVPTALTDGFRLAYLICAALCAAAAALTLLRLRIPGERSALRLARASAVFLPVLGLYCGLDIAFARPKATPLGAYVLTDTYSFPSAPNLHPPKIAFTDPHRGGWPVPGYILLTNFYNLSEPPIWGQSGPLILGENLQPVWFQPVPKRYVAGNLELQHYHGEPVLAWWQGKITNTGATEAGEWVVVNRHYQVVARLQGQDGWLPTLHEFQIVGEDAWVTANKNIPINLSRYGGPYNGALIDVAAQEYNLRTGQLLYSWDALQHVPLSDSYATTPTNGFPWDAYHINAIQPLGNGKLLVSLRNTWAIYLIEQSSGRILWTLGGRSSSFKFGQGAEFQWQHDARLTGPTTVTVFDDHCCQLTSGGTYVTPTAPSRGLVLHLNFAAHTATVERVYRHHPPIDAAYMGNVQPLPTGQTFVGWGSEPYFTLYGPNGEVQLEGILPGPNLTYRAYVASWEGEPLQPPAVALRRQGDKEIAYMSWNGATKLARWQLLGGPSATDLHPLGEGQRTGFETALPVPPGTAFIQARALSSTGRVLASSPVVSAR